MSVLVNQPAKKVFSRWRWLYSSLAIPNEAGEIAPGVYDLKLSDIERYGSAKDLNKINWLSFDDLDDNADLMDSNKAARIRAIIDEKYHYISEKHKQNSTKYVGNTIMLTMADDCYAPEVCQCGTVGIGVTAEKKPCSRWKYCDRCSNVKRQYYYLKYSSAYSENSYMITLTMSEKVKFIDGNLEQVIRDWNKLNGYVDMMYKNKMIVGGVRCEEMSIDNLYPMTIVNPHLHVLCHGVNDLKSHEFEGIKINVKKIKDQEHWNNSLNYLFKSMDLYSTYVREWTKKNGVKVNRNIRECIENHRFIIKNRNQARAFGTFHGLTKTPASDSIKNIRNKPLQSKGKKIKCKKPMYEDFKKGIEDKLQTPLRTDTLIKQAFDQLNNKRPWYKNPWVLGGAALGGGAALYGAGKLYNGGDNLVNNSFGAGVDKYLVNPVKNLFSPNTPTPNPANEPSSGQLNGVSPLRREYHDLWKKELGNNPQDTAVDKIRGGILDKRLEMSGLSGQMSSLINTPKGGTDFAGVPDTELSNGVNSIQNALKDRTQIPDSAIKNFLSQDSGKGDQIKRFGDWYGHAPTSALTDYRNILKMNPDTTADKVVGGVNEYVGQPSATAGLLGLGARGASLIPGVASSRLGAAAGGYMKGLGKVMTPLAPVLDGAAGYNLGENAGMNKGLTTAGGVGAGMLSAALAAKHPVGSVVAAMGVPAINGTFNHFNNFYTEQAGASNVTGGLANEFLNAHKALNAGDSNPIRALMQSDTFNKITSKPQEYLKDFGAPEGQVVDNKLMSALMYAKREGVKGLLGNKLQDIFSKGSSLVPKYEYRGPNYSMMGGY